MSKFFDRLTGTYVETEMVIFTLVDRFYTASKVGFKKCYIQFKRGELTERSNQTFDIQAGEQTPNDNVQMALYSPTQSRFNASSCPGPGLTSSPTGSGAYCQVLGTWRMHLPGYNTIPLYAGMNNACPSQWRPASVGKSYQRCADGSLTCC